QTMKEGCSYEFRFLGYGHDLVNCPINTIVTFSELSPCSGEDITNGTNSTPVQMTCLDGSLYEPIGVNISGSSVGKNLFILMDQPANQQPAWFEYVTGPITLDADANHIVIQPVLISPNGNGVLSWGFYDNFILVPLDEVQLDIITEVDFNQPCIGQNVTYTFTIANNTDTDVATNIDFIDILPASLQAIGGDFDLSTLVATVPAIKLKAGGEVKLTLTATVGGTVGVDIVNEIVTATTGCAGACSNPVTSNSKITITPSINQLSINSTWDNNNITCGSQGVPTYETEVCNLSGTGTADGLILELSYTSLNVVSFTSPTSEPFTIGNVGDNHTISFTDPFNLSIAGFPDECKTFELELTSLLPIGDFELCGSIVNEGFVCGVTEFCDIISVAPDPNFSVTSSTVDATCNSCDGSAQVFTTAGIPPITFLWSDPGSQTAAQATNLCAVNYFVTVTDANNCNVIKNITVDGATPLISETFITDETCAGASDAQVAFSVETEVSVKPITFLWVGPGGGLTSTSSAINTIAAGTYTVTITDNTGCSVTQEAVVGPGVSPCPTCNGVVGITGRGFDDQTFCDAQLLETPCPTFKYGYIIDFRNNGGTDYDIGTKFIVQLDPNMEFSQIATVANSNTCGLTEPTIISNSVDGDLLEFLTTSSLGTSSPNNRCKLKIEI
ncbi:MAG: hypothetical protein IH948_10820, partial [Bacteroidetes bacterium]|nr:hypothetical protein [Bacteroidota bacterium]